MRLVNPELYGWETARTAHLEHEMLADGVPVAWVSVPRGPDGGRLDLLVRARTHERQWHPPHPGERHEVLTWRLTPAQVDDLQVARDLALPDAPIPEGRPQVLWLEG